MPDVKRPILFCGENPAMTLFAPGDGPALAVASYWHCTYSPLGAGHALVLWLAQPESASPLGSAIYTDSPPLARMLAETLTQHFPEFRGIPVASLPYVRAECSHQSDDEQRYTVSCATPQGSLVLQWAGMLDQKQLIWPQFPAGPRSFDLTTVICPCRHATIAIDGRPLPGEVRLSESDGRPSSSAFLAFAETWVGALDA